MNGVQNWLTSVLGPVSAQSPGGKAIETRPQYTKRDLVFAETIELLAAYPSLSPKTASYTHDDGRTQILLCLQGTLPIQFKSKTYNIPLAVWVPYNYPLSPPITYVTPTATMLVRPSVNVDVSGRCAGDYLAGWERRSEVARLRMP
jgi:ESCRT-I complex subunit TSG101